MPRSGEWTGLGYHLRYTHSKTDRLIDGWLTGWLIECLINRLVDRLNGWLIAELIGWLIGWLSQAIINSNSYLFQSSPSWSQGAKHHTPEAKISNTGIEGSSKKTTDKTAHATPEKNSLGHYKRRTALRSAPKSSKYLYSFTTNHTRVGETTPETMKRQHVFTRINSR